MLTPWAVHLFRSPFKVKPPFTQVNFEIKHDYRILAPKSSSCVLTLRFVFHLFFFWDETSSYTETEDLSIAVVVAFYLVVCVCWCRCVAAIVHGAWSVEYHPAYDCWCCRSTDETTHFMCRKFWTSMDCSFFLSFRCLVIFRVVVHTKQHEWWLDVIILGIRSLSFILYPYIFMSGERIHIYTFRYTQHGTIKS